MRAHTRTYVTDFAARVDERTEDPAVQGFGSATLESKGFARAGRASVNRSVTAVQQAEIFTSQEVFQKISAVAGFVSGLRADILCPPLNWILTYCSNRRLLP